jgi:hypothetical protein
MKRNWLKTVAIVISLVAGSITSTAFAGNKGGPGGGTTHSFQGSGPTNIARSIGTNQTFQPQIKTLSGNTFQLQDRQHSPSLNVTQLNNAVQGIQLKNNLDLSKKIGNVLDKPQLHFNPDLTKKLDGAFNKPQLPFNPDLNKKITPAILDKKCLPGCFPGCKPGCYPWWWSPCWNSCYSSCYPCYYYPTIYTQPIVIPVTTVATTVAADGVAPVAGVIEDKLMQVPVGATLTLQAKDLGDKAGQVILQMDKIALPGQVSEWKNDSVTATLPMIGLNGNVKAEIMLVKPDGSLGSSVKVELIPAQQPTQSSDAAAGAAR